MHISGTFPSLLTPLSLDDLLAIFVCGLGRPVLSMQIPAQVPHIGQCLSNTWISTQMEVCYREGTSCLLSWIPS